jgi:hypothetical protein
MKELPQSFALNEKEHLLGNKVTLFNETPMHKVIHDFHQTRV